VTLTAQADVGSSFGGWSGGGCSGTGTCIVTLGASTGVTATFIQAILQLDRDDVGAGHRNEHPRRHQLRTDVHRRLRAAHRRHADRHSGRVRDVHRLERRLLRRRRHLHDDNDRIPFGHRGLHDHVRGAFVDDPLVARSTIIKAVHLTELRLAIDRSRARRSLPPFAWTDLVIVPRVTAVRVLHVTQMRTALIEAYQAAQRTPPTFSDATLAAGPVRAVHIAELRAAVLALP